RIGPYRLGPSRQRKRDEHIRRLTVAAAVAEPSTIETKDLPGAGHGDPAGRNVVHHPHRIPPSPDVRGVTLDPEGPVDGVEVQLHGPSEPNCGGAGQVMRLGELRRR